MRKTVLFTLLNMVLALGIFTMVGRHSANADSTYNNTYNTTYGTNVSCTFCHTSGSALNATGTKFKNSGFNYASISPVPVVTAFTIPATSTSLTVAIATFTATDNVPITGYLVSESSAPPNASATGWNATPPTSYVFATVGVKTLYGWAKDAANVVSTGMKSASTTITLPPAADTTPPTVNSFTIPSTSSSLTVSITSFTATDNVGVTGYLVTESASKPSSSASGWVASSPSNYTFTTAGAKTLHAWAKDAAGNVSASKNTSVTITLASVQDMAVWIGQWFKVSIKIDGYYFGNSILSNQKSQSGRDEDNEDESQSFIASGGHEKIAGYLKIWSWDPDKKILQGDLYESDGIGGWIAESLPLHYIGGNDLNFFCWFQTSGDYTTGFTVRIRGREVNGILKNATLQTLGGYYFEVDNASNPPQFWAGEFSITGISVLESKVPVPSNIQLH